MTKSALLVMFAATFTASALALPVLAADRPEYGDLPKDSERVMTAKPKIRSDRPEYTDTMTASDSVISPSGAAPLGGGMGYYGVPSLAVGMWLDEKIAPHPAGVKAETMAKAIEHLNDSLDVISYQLKDLSVQRRKITQAAEEAKKIGAALSGEALAKHNKEYTEPYQIQLRGLEDDQKDFVAERSELRQELLQRLKMEKRSAGFIVLTPKERIAAQKKGLSCGEGEQSVKRNGLTMNASDDYGCLNTDGMLSKLTQSNQDQIVSVSSYERDNGKLKKILVRTIDGKIAQELTYTDGKNKVKMFGPTGEEFSSCEYSSKFTYTLDYGDGGGNKSLKRVDR